MGRKKKYYDEATKKAAFALQKKTKRAVTANSKSKRQNYEK